MDIEGNEDREASPIPYLPELGQGEKLAEDEELVADMTCEWARVTLQRSRRARSLRGSASNATVSETDGSPYSPPSPAYVFLHHARLTWPCLSFDILRDVSRGARFKLNTDACSVS